MNFKSYGDKQNIAKLVQEIFITKLKNEMSELEDGYDIPPDIVEELTLNLYVNYNKKSLWKAGKTRFTKAFDKEVTNMIQNNIASFEDLGILLYLATTYTGHEDNYLKKDGEYLSKKQLIEEIHNDTKNNSRTSISYLQKKFCELEKKYLILSEPHPTDRRNKVFYLSPHLFYKGKYMDDKVKRVLLSVAKTVHTELKRINEEGNIMIPLDSEFEKKDNDSIIDEMLEYLNNAS